MTIYRRQYEEIEIGVRRDFLQRLEGYLRFNSPSIFAETPPHEIKASLNSSVNRAATFGFGNEREVERFVLLDLTKKASPQFFSRDDIRGLQANRSLDASEKIARLERLART